MLTLEQAKELRQGAMLYESNTFGADKHLKRWKVTSVKTWKRQPNKVEIHLQHGLYTFGRITELNLDVMQLTDEVNSNGQ